MPRIRSVKPEIWNSEDYMALTATGQRAFLALITLADDDGRVKSTAAHLDAICLRTGDVVEVQDQLDQMEDQDMIHQYLVGRATFIYLVNWEKHQRVQHKSDSTYPPPDDPRAVPLREHSGGFRNVPEASHHDTNIQEPCRTTPEDFHHAPASRAAADRRGSDQIKDLIGGEGSVRGGVSADAEPAVLAPVDDLTRIDVEQLCQRMVESVVARDEPRPRVTEAWRKDARLLLDRDRRPLQEALALIDWLTEDPFWRANVLAIPTFRKQYAKLRLGRERGEKRGASRLDDANGQWESIGREWRAVHGDA